MAMGRRSNQKKRSNKAKSSGGGNGRRTALRQALSIGALAFVIAVFSGGPLGAVLQSVDVWTSVLLLLLVILIGILADIIAVAATAVKDVPLNAMASDKVPGAQEALIIVRNAGRVNSIFADIVGDIVGTITGVMATPIIFAITAAYPDIPPVIVSAVVIGLIAFLTIGGKALEKDLAVRQSTSVILWVGKVIYFFNRLRRIGQQRGKGR